MAGPLAALVAYRLLPGQYRNAASGDVLALISGARATMAAMAWMVV